jgi:competence protein ComEA
MRMIIAALLAVGLTAGVTSAQESARTPAQKPAAAAAVNLNTASAAQLESLPGIGPSMAQRIVEYRQQSGGFKKIEELMNVRGIGEATFLKLKELIVVTPARTERAATQ